MFVKNPPFDARAVTSGKHRDRTMFMAKSDSFEFSTPAMEVERAVAELRFGRPVIIKDGDVRLAALALDCAAPQVYDQFAKVTDKRHALLLSGPRAERLGVPGTRGISVPLADVDFEAASRLSYALGAKLPANWSKADHAMLEAAELARTALLLPAMVCADISHIQSRFAACHTLDSATLDKAGATRQQLEKIARTRVPLRDIGDVEFVVFRGGLALKDQVAIVVGKPDLTEPVPVRIHSSCITGDLYGSLKCDCGDQLIKGLAHLKEAGGGVLIYLDQEGRGTGIGAKMRAYGYQHLGLDTIDADAELGFDADHRRYETAISVLRLLDIPSVVLYSNNPSKIAALREGGIEVHAQQPVFGDITAENLNYLRTKMLRAGHMFDLETLRTAD